MDVAVDILNQIFKSALSKINAVWKSLRTSLKSIFNAIFDFISGKTRSYKDLLSIIMKGILSAITIAGAIALETKLEMILSPIISPTISAFVSPILSIIVSSIALVSLSKGIDLALNAVFCSFAERDAEKIKREEMAKIIEETLPTLVNERRELENLFNTDREARKIKLDDSFSKFKKGFAETNTSTFSNALININAAYGKTLRYSSFEEFKSAMDDDDHIFEF